MRRVIGGLLIVIGVVLVMRPGIGSAQLDLVNVQEVPVEGSKTGGGVLVFGEEGRNPSCSVTRTFLNASGIEVTLEILDEDGTVVKTIEMRLFEEVTTVIAASDVTPTMFLRTNGGELVPMERIESDECDPTTTTTEPTTTTTESTTTTTESTTTTTESTTTTSSTTTSTTVPSTTTTERQPTTTTAAPTTTASTTTTLLVVAAPVSTTELRTLTTTPIVSVQSSPSLPVTGSDTWAWLVVGAACLVVGLAMVVSYSRQLAR